MLKINSFFFLIVGDKVFLIVSMIGSTKKDFQFSFCLTFKTIITMFNG